MNALKEDSRQLDIEPQFLTQAQTAGIIVRICQMNKIEHEGIIRDIGRYDVNLEVNGKIITLLKQELSCITAPRSIVTVTKPEHPAVPSDQPHNDNAAARPNIQHEFLDKAIRENQMLTLYLINGHRIRANIEAFDNFTLLLKEGEQQHLYYKHSITTINR